MRKDQALALRCAFDELERVATRVEELKERGVLDRVLFTAGPVAAFDNYCHNAGPECEERRDRADLGNGMTLR